MGVFVVGGGNELMLVILARCFGGVAGFVEEGLAQCGVSSAI